MSRMGFSLPVCMALLANSSGSPSHMTTVLPVGMIWKSSARSLSHTGILLPVSMSLQTYSTGSLCHTGILLPVRIGLQT